MPSPAISYTSWGRASLPDALTTAFCWRSCRNPVPIDDPLGLCEKCKEEMRTW